jgi:hypothetical protein
MDAETEREILRAIVRELVAVNDTRHGALSDVHAALGPEAEAVCAAALDASGGLPGRAPGGAVT